MSELLPMTIPPARRLVRSPLAWFCRDCETLTRNGGTCPGSPPPAVVLSPRAKPMCHHEQLPGVLAAMARIRARVDPWAIRQ